MKLDPRPWAHTPNALGRPHYLEDHLEEVAKSSERLAAKFGAAALGYMAGLLHDVGKFRPEFQDYIHRCHESPEDAKRGEVAHSPFGCVFCEGDIEFLWPAIAGHHGGIYHLDDNERKELLERHRLGTEALSREADLFVADKRKTATIEAPFGSSCSLSEPLLRMLFSCLVDADSESTARHMGEHLELQYPSLADCLAVFVARYHDTFTKASTGINGIRWQVFRDCVANASKGMGFFRLTAPTGCGKTLSSLAFALKHAQSHDTLDRIIYAAPYTSIIDQTAAEFRRFLPPGAVLEHHSAVDSEDTERQDAAAQRRRQETLRWEAPVIVTTTVQLLESLFANKRSKCRKLHNLARSIIILDEAQSLPPHLLEPTLDMLKALVDAFGCTIVLCTATQPALSEDSPLRQKLPSHPEIMSDVPNLFHSLKRVDYEFMDEPLTVVRLAEQVQGAMATYGRVLVVANTKRVAVDLWQALDDPEVLHLSTLLCPAHRKQILEQVKATPAGRCCLVSTQVIEAGVDIDFPMVFREFGPLERIVQAAGRCNRNGTPGSAPFGRVFVFNLTDTKVPPGPYSLAIQAARLELASGRDLHSPDLYSRFFRLFYGSLADTGQAVQERRLHFDYPRVAELYKLIEDDTSPVLVEVQVPLAGKAREAYDRVARTGTASMDDWVALQSYSVSLRHRELQSRLSGPDLVRDWIPGLHLWRGSYHPRLGLGMDIRLAAEDFVC